MTRVWEDGMAHELWGEQLCEHIIWTNKKWERTAQNRQKMAQNSSNGERASTLLIHCYWSNEEVLIVILLKVISTERDSLSKNFFRSSPLLLLPHFASPSSQQQQSPKMLQIFPWKLCAIFFPPPLVASFTLITGKVCSSEAERWRKNKIEWEFPPSCLLARLGVVMGASK